MEGKFDQNLESQFRVNRNVNVFPYGSLFPNVVIEKNLCKNPKYNHIPNLSLDINRRQIGSMCHSKNHFCELKGPHNGYISKNSV